MNLDESIIYNSWNFYKKFISRQDLHTSIYPKRGEVWYVALGRNIGREQNGIGVEFERPVLIIKRWNSEMVWCVPLSTKQKNLDFYYNFTDPFKRSVSVILAQLRTISTKRCKRKLYKLNRRTFDIIRLELQKHI